MTTLQESLSANLAAVKQRVAEACYRAQRDAREVTLVCVSKTVDASTIRAAYEVGARDFGENYGQELRDKAAALADLPGLRWHFIGALQRNKVKYAAGKVSLIHSADSPALVAEIERRAVQAGQPQDVLVQLNLAAEQTKSGIAAKELSALLDSFGPCTHARCTGLMTMPPFFDEPQRARPLFARLRELMRQAGAEGRPRVSLQHLSMGMSGDFEVAIEEGATLVRVGTAIFGPRSHR